MALLLSSTGDRVQVDPGLTWPEASTTILWVYPTTLTTLRRILSQQGTPYEHALVLDFVDPTQVFVEIVGATSSGTATTTDLNLTTGKWWCIAVTEDTSGSPLIYVGDLATKMRLCGLTSTATRTGAVQTGSDLGLTIGNLVAGNQTFQGRIGFVGRWRRKMTIGELWQQQWAPHPDADCEVFMWNGLMWDTTPDFGIDATTESHTGTTGSTSQASFDISHALGAGARGLLVFTFVNANADNATSVKLDPAGLNIDVPAVSGGRAVDTAGEPGDCKAWFLSDVGPAMAGGTRTIRINRTNNANVMYAVAVSYVGAYPMEVVNTPTLQQTDGTLAVVAQDTVRRTAIRMAAINSGLADVGAAAANTLAVGAGTTLAQSIDFGTRVAAVAYETTKGSGSRSMGWSAATSDDRAAVYLAIAEMIRDPNLAPLAAGKHAKIIGGVQAPNVPLWIPFGAEVGVSGT